MKSVGETFPDARIKICDMVVDDSRNKLTGNTLNWRCGDVDPYVFISLAESDQFVPPSDTTAIQCVKSHLLTRHIPFNSEWTFTAIPCRWTHRSHNG